MKSRLVLFSLITVLLATGVILPLRVGASTADSILVNIVPENPAPNENININLSSYANNLDSVLITWSLNGKNASSRIGKKSFSLTAPSAGGETTVIAKIVLPDGEIEKRIIIRPAVMVLLWQANDSYVPPFYKGKALPTPDSEIKVVALPEILDSALGAKERLRRYLDPKNMVYAWRQDYANDQGSSGYGKNFFTYINDYLENSNNISVTATTVDQKYSSEANIDIKTANPKILFYKNDTSLGTIWDQALFNGHKISGDEIIEATPYFISPKDIRIPILTWNWSINDSLINISNYRKNLIPLQTQAGVSGTAKIKLEIENKYKIFANISKEINVEF